MANTLPNNTNQSSPHQKTPDVSLQPLPKNANSLSEITITDKEIKKAIDDMVITLAPWADGFTGSIYKEYADQLIYPMKIWKASLESGKFSEVTAQAIIAPIYKRRVKNNTVNYQWPVALSNH